MTDETKRKMQFLLENSEQLILIDTYFLFLYDIYYFSLIRQSISYQITQWNNRQINNLQLQPWLNLSDHFSGILQLIEMKLSVVAVTLKIPLNCEVRSTLPAKVKRKINENFTGENNGPGALFLLTSSVRLCGCLDQRTRRYPTLHGRIRGGWFHPDAQMMVHLTAVVLCALIKKRGWLALYCSRDTSNGFCSIH